MQSEKGKLKVIAGILLIGLTAFGSDRYTKSISVETDPPGMRIYFCISATETNAMAAREYVGASPCSVKVKVDSDGRFQNQISSFKHPVAVFMAEPPALQTNLYPQKQAFPVPSLFHKAAKAPDAVFFDMNKKP
ncbi:MAG: hypothetical protein P4N60_19800 [Verrucomicrobiae bacterium]|nr:hypothetical protein [Verrucomicrobiae bacterium]